MEHVAALEREKEHLQARLFKATVTDRLARLRWRLARISNKSRKKELVDQIRRTDKQIARWNRLTRIADRLNAGESVAIGDDALCIVMELYAKPEDRDEKDSERRNARIAYVQGRLGGANLEYDYGYLEAPYKIECPIPVIDQAPSRFFTTIDPEVFLRDMPWVIDAEAIPNVVKVTPANRTGSLTEAYFEDRQSVVDELGGEVPEEFYKGDDGYWCARSKYYVCVYRLAAK